MMDGNSADLNDPHQPSVNDPNLVNKLVEELKSQGIFDQIRSDCLAEVDTKPAYQNLRQRVESTVTKYLNKQPSWKPTQNKTQMRNMLRKHIQDSHYLEAGVEGIVDQVVGPKILTHIEPEVESIMYKMFGIEKPESANNSEEDEPMNVEQNEDVEMKSEEENTEAVTEDKADTDASSPGPGLRGDMSPLTPDRQSEEKPGNISPLTPPPPGTENLPSPRTPPMPPPVKSDVFENVVVEEEIVAARDEDVSPVSDAELGDISPPKASPETPDDSGMPSPPPPPLPPLPPPPQISEPRTPPLPPPPPTRKTKSSPLTSPIESSSDEMNKMSASDISDAELPAQSEKESSDDLEELEKARAELQAKLAAAGISDDASASEETSDSDHKKDKTTTEDEDDDHQQAKRKSPPKDDDDSGSGSGSGGQQDPSGQPPPSSSTDDKSSGSGSSESKSKSSSSGGERRSSKDSKEHRHHHHRSSHHKSHKKSHKKDKERKDSESKEKRRESTDSNKKDHKDKHKEKVEKSKQKLAEIDAKIKQKETCTLKSNKFKGFDMFAPKTPVQHRSPAMPTPIKTPKPPKSPAILTASNPTSSPISSPKVQEKERKTPTLAKAISNEKKPEKKKVVDSFIVHDDKRKVYPELPVPQIEGIDKDKQHRDDIAETKRRLEEARQRKLAEKMKEKELKKLAQKSAGSSSGSASSKKARTMSTSSASSTPSMTKKEQPETDIKRYNNKKDDSDSSDSDIEWQKKAVVNKKLSKKKKYAQVSSDEDEEPGIVDYGQSPIISTRKSQQKTAADAILNDDDDILGGKPFHGFEPQEIESISAQLKILNHLLAAKNAKTVPSPKQDNAKNRKRRIYTDAETSKKHGVNKKAKVVLDDIEAQLAEMEDLNQPSKSNVASMDMDDDAEESFRGFPEFEVPEKFNKIIINYLDLYDNNEVNDNDPKLEVLISPALLSHMKKVLVGDKKALSALSKIKGRLPDMRSHDDSSSVDTTSLPPKPVESTKKAPTDYPMPPSPESNSPSDGSEKGSSSPQNETTSIVTPSKPAVGATKKATTAPLISSRPTRRSARRAC